MNYESIVQKILEQDLSNPSNEIVKYFLSNSGLDGTDSITPQMIEQYREATKKAMQKFIDNSSNKLKDIPMLEIPVLEVPVLETPVLEQSKIETSQESFAIEEQPVIDETVAESSLKVPDLENTESIESSIESITVKETISAPIVEEIAEISTESVATEEPQTIENQIESVEIQESVMETIEETDEIQPVTLESICETILKIAETSIQDFSHKIEDSDDFRRLHIYTSENRKVGAVKILKNDLSIQWRKFENGIPTVYDLNCAENFKNYI